MNLSRIHHLWTVGILIVACGGNVAKNQGDSPGSGAATTGGTGGTALVTSGGASSGGSTGGTLGTGGLYPLIDCGPGIGKCAPQDCAAIDDANTLTQRLQSVCSFGNSSLPAYTVRVGCGYVDVSWSGEVWDQGTDHYDLASGRLVGSQGPGGECNVSIGAIPQCSWWQPTDPCLELTPRSECGTARTAVQLTLDDAVSNGQGCSKDSDCTIAKYSFACGEVCPFAVSAAQLDSMSTKIANWDESGVCRSCAGIASENCPTAPSKARCLDGQCVPDGEYPNAGQFAPLMEPVP